MAIQLNPYLNFKDQARAAMEFYKSVFDGELNLQTFKDFGASKDSSEDNLVMHSELRIPNGLMFMAADTPARMEYKPAAGFSMSISGDETELMTSYFNKLAEGGTITMPLEKAMWGDTFGMLIDKFGVSWLINISPAGR